MSIHVAHPRIMLVLWACLAAAVATLSLVAAEQSDSTELRLEPVLGPTPVALAADAPATFDSILVQSPELKSIIRDTPYRTFDHRVAQRDNAQFGTTASLVLDKPIESKGPWKFLACQGTRQVIQEATWSNVTVLFVTLDADGRVIELAPGRTPNPANPEPGDWIGDDAVPDNAAAATAPTYVNDLVGSRELWRSTEGESLQDNASVLACPEGTNED